MDVAFIMPFTAKSGDPRGNLSDGRITRLRISLNS